LWWYVCEECAKQVGGTSLEEIPKEALERWRERNDPRATCEYCGERETKYEVEGEADSFIPDLLTKHGIRV